MFILTSTPLSWGCRIAPAAKTSGYCHTNTCSFRALHKHIKILPVSCFFLLILQLSVFGYFPFSTLGWALPLFSPTAVTTLSFLSTPRLTFSFFVSTIHSTLTPAHLFFHFGSRFSRHSFHCAECHWPSSLLPDSNPSFPSLNQSKQGHQIYTA